VLELDGLSRRYGDRVAIEGLRFSVKRGQLHGFVGPNRAGKTTAMRIAMGLLAPDGGTVRLDGRPVTDEDRRRFGYMPQERGLYPRIVPVTAPIAMPARVALVDVPTWEILLAAVLTLVTALLVLRLAAAIHRATALRMGQRIPLREAVREAF
jgi:ABC-type sugar transport system ATPase subunit